MCCSAVLRVSCLCVTVRCGLLVVGGWLLGVRCSLFVASVGCVLFGVGRPCRWSVAVFGVVC